MKRIAMILLGVLSIPAYGGIASQEYVDSELGNVSTTISTKADKTGYAANMLLQTKDDGKLTATTLKTGMIENGAVTNSKLASGIGLDKLDMGTLPTSGKHIMIWNSGTNKYVFEELIKPARQPLQCPLTKWTLECLEDCDDYCEDCYTDGYESGYEYDIGFDQCVDQSIDGDAYGYYSHDGQDKNNDTTYNLSAGEWAVEFSYGVVKGTALCSGSDCLCKTTSPAASSWESSFGDYDDGDICRSDCASRCADSVQRDIRFRVSIFSAVGK